MVMQQTEEVIHQVTANLLQTPDLCITDHLQEVLPLQEEYIQLLPEKADQPIQDLQAAAVVQVQAIHGQREAVQEVLTPVRQGVVPDQAIHVQAEVPGQVTQGPVVAQVPAIQGPQGAAVVEGLIHQAVAVAAEGHTLLLLPDLPGLPLVLPGLPLHQVVDEEDNISKSADLC